MAERFQSNSSTQRLGPADTEDWIMGIGEFTQGDQTEPRSLKAGVSCGSSGIESGWMPRGSSAGRDCGCGARGLHADQFERAFRFSDAREIGPRLRSGLGLVRQRPAVTPRSHHGTRHLAHLPLISALVISSLVSFNNSPAPKNRPVPTSSRQPPPHTGASPRPRALRTPFQ